MADHGHRKVEPAMVLRCGLSQDTAARALLRANVAGFNLRLVKLMAAEAPDAVHQTRVALRRLRATLQAVGPRIDARLHRDLTRRLRTLFQALGVVRDAEVLAEAEAGSGTRLTAAAQRKGQVLRKRLKAQHVLRLPAELDRIFAGKSWRNRRKPARALRKAPVEALAVAALDRAWTRAADLGSEISGLAPGRRHDLRKRIKSFRYIAEDFAPLWPGPAATAFVQALGDLQAELGLLNDSALAEARGLAPHPRAGPALSRAEALWHWLGAQFPWWHAPAGR
jgi:CHAD domain-containing protein